MRKKKKKNDDDAVFSCMMMTGGSNKCLFNAYDYHAFPSLFFSSFLSLSCVVRLSSLLIIAGWC